MPHNTKRIAVLPHHRKLGLRPGRFALDDLIWPFGQNRETRGRPLSELTANDHLVVLPRRSIHVLPFAGISAKVSVAVLEPMAIHGHHMRMLRWSHRRFHRVLTSNRQLLQTVPNGVFFPFGSTWLDESQAMDCTKTKMCSLIASSKTSLPGHVLRHEIANWVKCHRQTVDVMGRGYKAFVDKSEGLAPYRYSVVIENVREPNFFTEKLVDAILCKTVPIYWGCPNIGSFFDTEGMILCHSANDIRQAVGRMTEEDYVSRLPAIEAIQDTAKTFGKVWQRAASALLETDQNKLYQPVSCPQGALDVSLDAIEKIL